MKLLPDPRRSGDLASLLSVWLGLSLATVLISGLLMRAGAPPLSDLLFRSAPDLGLGIIASLAALVLLARFRGEQAIASVINISAFASLAMIILAATRIWDSSSAYSILTPGQAALNILSLGFWPWGFGPHALDRFFPAAFALGTAFVVWRQRQSAPRILTSALAVYLVTSTVTHCLSWLSVLLAKLRESSIEDIQDVYRILVSVQSGGYWVSGQAERFFAATGHQAETGLMAARAAIFFLAIVLILAGLAWRGLPALKQLAKRILTLESATTAVLFLIGMGIGWAGRSADSSFTNSLSLFVALISAAAFVYWMRWGMDIDNLAQDEIRNPSLPLPSGAIAPHDLETARLLLLIIALFGSALLGWPIFAGFAAAACLVWFSSRSGLDWGNGLVTRLAVFALMLLALGQAGLSFGLRNSTTASWQVWAIFGASLLAASVLLTDVVKKLALSRTWSMAIPVLGTLIPLVIIRQPVLWGFGILVIFVQLAVGYKATWRPRYAIFPSVFLLLIFAVFSVFWAKLWVTY